MPKFRKKPVVIEARQFTSPADADALAQWCNALSNRPSTELWIDTPEGRMTANLGDYIIQDVQGEFYPCKPDIFETTYEPADD